MALTTSRSRSDETDGTTGTSRSRRFAAAVATTAAVTGALSLGVTGPASADAGGEAPPAASWAAPAESGIPAVGDGGQDYWAWDDCHYYARGGTWYSDMCMSAIADAAGNVVPNMVSDFQNLGDGQLGRELLRMDFEKPGYVAVAPVSDVLTTWYVIALNDPSHVEVLGTTIDGKPQWSPSGINSPAGQSPVYDPDYDTSAKGQILWGLQQLASQTNTIMVNNAMGNPSWSFGF
jgi:hypothetical protein